MADESYTFDTARVRLEEIAAQVKRKDVSLEKSLDLLEEGVRLANACTEQIDQAQWRTPEPQAGEGAEQGAAAGAEAEDAAEAEAAPEAEASGAARVVEAETDEFAVVAISEDQVVIEYGAVVEEAAPESGAADAAAEGPEDPGVEAPAGE